MSDVAKQRGVILLGVLPGSKAAAAGLQRGDVILAINDKATSSMLDVVSLMEIESVKKVSLMRNNSFKEFDLDESIPAVDSDAIDYDALANML